MFLIRKGDDLMNALYNIFEKLKLIGVYLSGSAIFIMMLFIVADVTLRNLFKASLLGSYEITEYLLMPIVFFPSLAYVFSSGILPRIELLVIKFNQSYQRIIFIGFLVIELVLFSLLTFYGMKYALVGTKDLVGFSMRGSIISYYPILYFVPIGFLLLTIEILFIIIKNFQSKKPTLQFKE